MKGMISSVAVGLFLLGQTMVVNAATTIPLTVSATIPAAAIRN